MSFCYKNVLTKGLPKRGREPWVGRSDLGAAPLREAAEACLFK